MRRHLPGAAALSTGTSSPNWADGAASGNACHFTKCVGRHHSLERHRFVRAGNAIGNIHPPLSTHSWDGRSLRTNDRIIITACLATLVLSQRSPPQR